jgi:hypothetical protein
MGILREVWVEFADGSAAKYSGREEDLLPLINQLLNAGLACAIWVDGRIWDGERDLTSPGNGEFEV